MSRTMSSSPGNAVSRPNQTFSNFHTELTKCLQDLRDKRDEVNQALLREEEEKAKIQKEISMLTDRLSKINESLIRKQRAKEEYDKTIAESEQAYMKILDSSDALLQVLKKERDTLSKKKTGV